MDNLYRYEECENPYDRGTLIISVKETEKIISLKIVKKDMLYSTYVDVLFADKDKAIINKVRSPHAFAKGNGFYIIYPNRMGKPLCFVKV